MSANPSARSAKVRENFMVEPPSRVRKIGEQTTFKAKSVPSSIPEAQLAIKAIDLALLFHDGWASPWSGRRGSCQRI
jgi:hypothetical protein